MFIYVLTRVERDREKILSLKPLSTFIEYTHNIHNINHIIIIIIVIIVMIIIRCSTRTYDLYTG